MNKIKIGIPHNSIYLNLYKIYFEKLDFDVVESVEGSYNTYIENINDNILSLKNKCDYIIFPKYKTQNITNDYNCNFIIHEIDNDYEKFIQYISDKFYIDKKVGQLAYNEAIIKYLSK